MNIAIINTLGKSKSTGKIAYGLHQYLKSQGHHSIVCYGRRDEGVGNEADLIRFSSDWDNCTHAFSSRLLGDQGLHSVRCTKRLLRILEDHHTEAVYLLNLHGYYLNFPMVFEWLGKHSVKVIYLMLDEAPFLGKCCFALGCDRFQTGCGDCPQVREYPASLLLDRSRMLLERKHAAYEKIQDLTFVGIPYTVSRARRSLLLRDAVFCELDEAVDLRNTYYPRDTQALRIQLGIPQEHAVIVTVSPFSDPRKGGRYFLEAARRLEGKAALTFVHVGFDGDPAICPPNEIPISYVSDQNELAAYYSLGDVFVCTSVAETIANTCLEALSCGTPILSFDASGMPYCADPAHGTFVEVGNTDALTDAIASVKKKDAQMIASCRQYAESRYDSADYFRKLMDLLVRS